MSFPSCASRHIFFGQIFEKMDTRKKNEREVIFWGLFLIFEKSNKNKNGVYGDFVVFGPFWDQNGQKPSKNSVFCPKNSFFSIFLMIISTSNSPMQRNNLSFLKKIQKKNLKFFFLKIFQKVWSKSSESPF